MASEIIFEGVKLTLTNIENLGDATSTYSYEGDNFETAFFLHTYSNGYPEVIGEFLVNGSAYSINNCGLQCHHGHIIRKINDRILNPRDKKDSLDLSRNKIIPTTNSNGTESMPDGLGIGYSTHITKQHYSTNTGYPPNSANGTHTTKLEYPGNSIHSGVKTKEGNVKISVMVYYTSQFAGSSSLKEEGHTAESKIRLLVEYTNDVFRRSGISGVKLVLHGVPQPIDDVLGKNEVFPDSKNDNAEERLDAFEEAKGGNVNFLLNSADIAMLVTKYGTGGGSTTGLAVGGCSYKKKSDYSPEAVKHSEKYFGGNCKNGYSMLGTPIGWAMGQSGLNFAHEVGHILGAHHNPEEEVEKQELIDGKVPWNPVTTVAEGANHGYWTKAKYIGKKKFVGETGEFKYYEGMRTIMAYGRDLNSKSKVWYNMKPIAYFSTPKKKDRDTGIKLGDKYHDNSRQIWKVAHIASMRGDESCPYGADFECETCLDAYGEAFCQPYKHQCKNIDDPKKNWFPLGACRRTCKTCTTKNSDQQLNECCVQGKACGSK